MRLVEFGSGDQVIHINMEHLISVEEREDGVVLIMSNNYEYKVNDKITEVLMALDGQWD